MPRIAVVTDSTATLDPVQAAEWGVVVVPLQVVIGDASYDEGTADAAPELIAAALRGGVPVSTSRPTPSALLAAYRTAAEEGAEAVVSVHLSGEMSGTVESARLAARDAPVPVRVVDTRQVGFATGYAARAAADVVRRGGSVDAAADAAADVAARAVSLFYVDTLEYLRRGGRIGAAAALIGTALAVKPLLRVRDGRVDAFEKVRTAGKALARLADLAVTAAGPTGDTGDAGSHEAGFGSVVDVGVAHLASPERAEALAALLAERLVGRLAGGAVQCTELGAVLGAHAGPGIVAVCVSPRGGEAGLSTG